MATDIGRLGVWSFIDNLSAPEAAAFAQQLEAWGYSALWIPEAVNRDPFAIIGYLAAKTSKLILATGIANIYARDPMTMKAIRKTLAELAPGRIVIGLGVSHSHLVHNVRGHEYSNKPVSTMRAYLEGMEKALYMGKEPAEEAPVVLAALRQNMLKLAAEKTHGAHPYFVTPEHTARARHDGAGCLAVPRADGAAGDRPGEGTRGRAQEHGYLPGAAQLPEQPARVRLRQRGLRRRRQ